MIVFLGSRLQSPGASAQPVVWLDDIAYAASVPVLFAMALQEVAREAGSAREQCLIDPAGFPAAWFFYKLFKKWVLTNLYYALYSIMRKG
ncbi:MAG: hypothetical protein MZU97_13460 [Bacillus subtilis]|nr:hypothetical protein [Bacillus subtilis]